MCLQQRCLCCILCFLHACSNNAIDVEGSKAMAAALAANTTLKSIILSDNYIGVEGAKALAEVRSLGEA